MKRDESDPICRVCLNFIGPGEACECEVPRPIPAVQAEKGGLWRLKPDPRAVDYGRFVR